MRIGRVLAGCLCAAVLASCGGKVKAPGVVPFPPNYDPNAPLPGAQPTPQPLPSTAPTPRPSGQGTVQGEVRDVQGRGLGNVKVMLDGSSDVVATTSFNGSFTLSNVPAGWQFVTFQYQGQTFAGAVEVAPSQAVSMAPVTFDDQFAAFGNQANGSFDLPRKTLLNTWRITNVAAWSGAIYVTAVDDEGKLKDGTVYRLDLRRTKKWEQIGDKWLGLSKPLSYTASGLAVAGETLYATDTAKGLFTLDPYKGKPKRVEKTGYRDVAAGGGKVYFAGDSGIMAGSSVDDLTALAGVSASGGIGADPNGTLYAVSGSTIVKYGDKAETFAEGLNAPIDVAADRQGFVYVLEPGGVKRFDKAGKLVGSVATGAEVPVGIAVDESGALYVADKAAGDKPSRILRFTAATEATTPAPQPSGWGDPYGSGYGGYTDPYGSGYDDPYGTGGGDYDPYAAGSDYDPYASDAGGYY